MNVDNVVSSAQSLRHQAKAMLEAATAQDKAQTETSVALGNAPILFPKPRAVILSANGTAEATATPSRNAPLEQIALKLGEVYAQLESLKAAYVTAKADVSIGALAVASEATMCLGVINALSGYLSGAGLVASAVSAALGGGQVPAGYQKSGGGILLPAKAS